MDEDTWLGEYTQGCRHLWPVAVFTPPAHRRQILAFLALDAELRRIPRKVKEPTLRAIRYQWWRDALAPTHGEDSSRSGGDGNPLVGTLREILNTRFHGLETVATALIDAAQDRSDPPPSLAHAGQSRQIIDLAAAVARAQGVLIKGVLDAPRGDDGETRTDPLFAALHVLEILMISTFSQAPKDRGTGQKSEKRFRLDDSLLEFCARRLDDASRLSGGVNKALAPAFVTIPLARYFLRDMGKRDFSAKHPMRGGPCARVSPWRMARLGWAVRRGRF